MKQIIRRLAVLLAAAALVVPAWGFGDGAAGTPPAARSTQVAAVKVLKSGSKGEEVRQLQLRLIELGYDPGSADGIFGKGTKTALQDFQRRNGLEADGQAGQQTQEKLYSDTAVGIPKPEPVDVLAGELPMLVNKSHPVDESLYPADMVLLTDALDSKLVKIKYADTLAVREAAEAIEEMLEAAKADGVTNWQISNAYRSYTYQERTLENKIRSFRNSHKDWSREKAREAALRTVAEPGCSEHQLGLAIDINVPGKSFAGTRQCKWLHAHCWEYGFIVRYTADKKAITGIDAEAWHIRYVGVDHALRIRDLGLCLEEYLEGIEDGTIRLFPEDEPEETDDGPGNEKIGVTDQIEEIILGDE